VIQDSWAECSRHCHDMDVGSRSSPPSQHSLQSNESLVSGCGLRQRDFRCRQICWRNADRELDICSSLCRLRPGGDTGIAWSHMSLCRHMSESRYHQGPSAQSRSLTSATFDIEQRCTTYLTDSIVPYFQVSGPLLRDTSFYSPLRSYDMHIV
jgi:hypothetical protein